MLTTLPVQVAQLEQDLRPLVLPLRMQLPSSTRFVRTETAYMLTGTRFVNHLSVYNAQSGHGAKSEDSTHADTQSSSKTSAFRDTPSQWAMDAITDIFNEQAPTQVCTGQVTELAWAATYCMADVVIQMMPAYLAPFIQQAPLPEVSLL